MTLGRLFNIFVAMVVLALGLSVAPTNLVAAACLIQFSILTAIELESELFRSLVDGYETVFSLVKLSLLLVALVLLL